MTAQEQIAQFKKKKEDISRSMDVVLSRSNLKISLIVYWMNIKHFTKHYGWFAILCIFAVIYIISQAWVSDSAYISFRVIDNFLEGFGLRWNISERVLVYNHPLWLLLHIPLEYLFSNIFLVTLGLSITCTVAAVYIALSTHRRRVELMAVFFIIPLLFSQAYIDFTSSGFEVPLTLFFFGVFVRLYHIEQAEVPWTKIFLTLSGALLTQPGAIFFYIPPMLALLHRRWRSIQLSELLFGFAPLLLWFGFSIVYYGTFLSQSHVSFFHASVGKFSLIAQGLVYLQDLIMRDLISFLLLCTGGVLTFYHLYKSHERTLCEIGLGIIVYSVFVIVTGGDAMFGRQWVLPIFASAWLCYASLTNTQRNIFAYIAVIGVLGFSKIVSFALESYWQQSLSSTEKRRIVDEREASAFGLSLFDSEHTRIRYKPEHLSIDDALQSRTHGEDVEIRGYNGLYGYYIGPRVHIIDYYGNTDPLISHLPVLNKHSWRIHSFRRKIPEGYSKAIETGDITGMEPLIQEYIQILQTITNDELWSWKRFKHIIAHILGDFEELLFPLKERILADRLKVKLLNELLVIYADSDIGLQEDNTYSAPAYSKLFLPLDTIPQKITIGFGLNDYIWRNDVPSDGVKFGILFLLESGKEVRAWSHHLNPIKNTYDRGEQTIELDMDFDLSYYLENMQGIVLETHPGQFKNNIGDWAYWSSISLDYGK